MEKDKIPKEVKEEILHDLNELLNNLEDDLKLDFKNGERGYASFEKSYQAIKRFTLKVLRKKIWKWQGKAKLSEVRVR